MSTKGDEKKETPDATKDAAESAPKNKRGEITVKVGKVSDSVAGAIALHELREAGAVEITRAERRSISAVVNGTPDAEQIRRRLGHGFTVDAGDGYLSVSW